MFKLLDQLLEYKFMLREQIKRELYSKYKNSLFGFFWNFITPLVQIATYVVVFTMLFKSNDAYHYVYLISGLVPWIYFSTTLQAGTSSITNYSDIVKKVNFPREILPISTALSNLVNFGISLVIAITISIVSGNGITWAILFLPLDLALYIMLVIGIILILSSINVYYRDMSYAVGLITFALMWATPILYESSLLPEGILTTLSYSNPLTHYIELFHCTIYRGTLPDAPSLTICVIFSILIMVIGIKIFDKMEKNFARAL